MSPEGESVEIVKWRNANDQNEKVNALVNKLVKKGMNKNDMVILTPFKPENSELVKVKGITEDIELTNIMKYKGLEKSIVILADIQADKPFSTRSLSENGHRTPRALPAGRSEKTMF
ncbi:MAG: hypothetical protein HQL46_05565 [Gammaproteobacteria bacterium]|nr:hypothetical protein [Gammaproteobacteria bacterium]